MGQGPKVENPVSPSGPVYIRSYALFQTSLFCFGALSLVGVTDDLAGVLHIGEVGLPDLVDVVLTLL